MSSGAPVERGTPIRYPSTALLCVDTEDGVSYNRDGFRIDNNVPSDIYINKGRPMMFGYMTRIALTEVNMEWTTPNVFGGEPVEQQEPNPPLTKYGPNNNTLTLNLWNTAADVDYGYARVYVPEGFYTLPEMCKALEAALQKYIPTIGDIETAWTVRWDNKDFSIIIETGAPAAGFVIVSGTVARPQEAPLSNLPALQEDLTYMLGLTPVASQEAFYVQIKSGYASMAYTPYIDIVSNLLTKNQNVADGDSNKRGRSALLARLYLSNTDIVPRTVSATYGPPAVEGDPQSGPLLSSTDNAIGVRPFVFRREFASPKQIQWNTTENIDIVDLRVLDRLGNVVYITPTNRTIKTEDETEEFVIIIGNTSDFQFTLQITEV